MLTKTSIKTHIKLEDAERYGRVGWDNNGFISPFRISTIVYLELCGAIESIREQQISQLHI